MRGVTFIESAYALKETKERLFPVSRHRSARIRKKLVRRHGGEYRMVPAAFGLPGGKILVHPEIAAEVRRQLGQAIGGPLEI